MQPITPFQFIKIRITGPLVKTSHIQGVQVGPGKDMQMYFKPLPLGGMFPQESFSALRVPLVATGDQKVEHELLINAESGD